jgi:Fur family ferric uptake transcriptional regulator
MLVARPGAKSILRIFINYDDSRMSTGVLEADLDVRVAQRLAEQGIRYTAGRRLAIRSLLELAGPVTASQLQKAIGKAVPLSSLYRTLALLDETGITDRTHDADGVARHELAEWLLGHHHHLVCSHCGEVEDVLLAPDVEIRLGGMVESIAKQAGYLPTGHRIDIEGICRQCRS